MERDFDFKMPECYSNLAHKSFSDINDFSLSLTFFLDEDCLIAVTNELKSIDKYLKTDENYLQISIV